VAGVAALMLAANPGLTPSQLDSLLLQNCEDLGAAGWDQIFGRGRVNAARAVQAAQSAPIADTQARPSPSESRGRRPGRLVPVDVTAWDLNGVTRVDLYVSGKLLATDAVAPYLFSWNSAAGADGPATLVASAYDASGNKGTSAPVAVTVDNVAERADGEPPMIALTSPPIPPRSAAW